MRSFSEVDAQYPTEHLFKESTRFTVNLTQLHGTGGELQCPICKGIIADARVSVKCLHRYCRLCIEQWIRAASGAEKRCPLCRKTFHSKRDLKQDKRFDRITAGLYGDVTDYKQKMDEEAELATKRYIDHRKSHAEASTPGLKPKPTPKSSDATMAAQNPSKTKATPSANIIHYIRPKTCPSQQHRLEEDCPPNASTSHSGSERLVGPAVVERSHMLFHGIDNEYNAVPLIEQTCEVSELDRGGGVESLMPVKVVPGEGLRRLELPRVFFSGKASIGSLAEFLCRQLELPENALEIKLQLSEHVEQVDDDMTVEELYLSQLGDLEVRYELRSHQ